MVHDGGDRRDNGRDQHVAGLATRDRPGHGAGRSVLVIEDEPNISEAIRFILRRDGWAVATHATGDGAVSRIEAESPDLVILDLMLPGQSGLDILQDLRRRPGHARLPVILLTARGQAATREMAQDCGASLFMAKPFANAELLAAVRQLVGV
jgi:two-component system, OmpR family, response regulator